MTDKKRKTTQGQFKRFRAECLRLQREWGLTEWELSFRCDVLDGAYADIAADYSGMTATLRLSSEVDAADDLMDAEGCAKHEMLHLLTAELHACGATRFMSQREMDGAWEKVSRRLEKIV